MKRFLENYYVTHTHTHTLTHTDMMFRQQSL